MSFDLLVATRERPDIVTSPSPVVAVDGPDAVEARDLPEALAAAVIAPRWVVEISVPIVGSDADVKQAVAFAFALAEKYEGAVYDPQEDEVVWPKPSGSSPDVS